MMDEGESQSDHKTLLRQWLRIAWMATGGRSTRRAVGDRGEQGLRLMSKWPKHAELVGRHAHRNRSCHRTISTNSQLRYFVPKMYAGAQSQGLEELTTESTSPVRDACRAVRLWLSRGDELSAVVGLCAPLQISAMKKKFYEFRHKVQGEMDCRRNVLVSRG